MTRIALIGYGRWGRNVHRTIDGLRDVELHSICRLRPELTSPGIRDATLVTSDVDSALRGADAAVVATHPSAHRGLALACLAACVPTMLEKPVALSLGDAEDVLDRFEAAGVPLLVDNVHLFSPAFEALRAMTASWSPVEIESEGGGPEPVRDYSALLDWGPHDVAMALSVLRATPDSSSVRRLPSASGELFEVSLSLGASSARLRVGTGFPSRRRRFEVRCGPRVAVYDGHGRHGLTVDGRPVRQPSEEPLRRAVLSLHRCASTGVTDWRFSVGLNRDVARVLTDPEAPPGL